MTAPNESSSLSAKLSFEIGDGDKEFLLFNTGKILDDNFLKNLNRVIWLCQDSLSPTKENCRTNYTDKFTYTELDVANRSWSRDFKDGGEIKLSNQTPGGPNNFNFKDDDESDESGDYEGEIPTSADQYCEHLRLSEISVAEQWIEIVNISKLLIKSENLQDCQIAIPNPDNPAKPYLSHSLADIAAIQPHQYHVVELALTKSFSKPNEKQNGRAIYIMDGDNSYHDTRYQPLGDGRTLAYFADGWKITYQPTPGAENVYQQFQTCEAGKHINAKTGNCVKDPDPPAECAEGQFRNPDTGRCKKNPEEKVLAECAEGQFRNPETNRCKKIASDDDLVPCAEGYERNPETNRCRKVTSAEESRFGVEPVSAEDANRVWIWAGIGGVAVLGALIAGQFHQEIGRGLSKLVGRFKK
jgi:hypothetical protein